MRFPSAASQWLRQSADLCTTLGVPLHAAMLILRARILATGELALVDKPRMPRSELRNVLIVASAAALADAEEQLQGWLQHKTERLDELAGALSEAVRAAAGAQLFRRPQDETRSRWLQGCWKNMAADPVTREFTIRFAATLDGNTRLDLFDALMP